MDTLKEIIKSILVHFLFLLEKDKQKRQPDTDVKIIALSGSAVMLWTLGGNIVVPSRIAKRMTTKIEQAASISEKYHDNHSAI
jgi:hypothetical protein